MFRGVQKDAACWARALVKFSRSSSPGRARPVPEAGNGLRPLKGDEAEQFLKAADLKALPMSSMRATRAWAW